MKKYFDCFDIPELEYAFYQIKAIHAKGLFDKGRGITVEVSEARDGVTRRQQRYYFGIVLPAILEQFKKQDDRFENYSLKSFDMLMRTSYFCDIVTDKKGFPLRVPKSMSMSVAWKDDVIAYITTLIALAASMGVNIPSPDEYFEGKK